MYVDDDNILDGRFLTIKKNTKLINSQKGGWKKINFNKTKCIVMTRAQDRGRNQGIKINNIFY